MAKDCLNLQNKIKAAREKKGWSQRQLAETVGVSRQTINAIENGQFNPSTKLALLISIALEQKVDELFYFE